MKAHASWDDDKRATGGQSTMDREIKAWFALLASGRLECSDKKQMLIDVCFFGLPLVISFCLAAHAVRDEQPKFWLPAFSMWAYCLFYLFGGRDVILWLLLIMTLGGGVLNSGGLVG